MIISIVHFQKRCLAHCDCPYKWKVRARGEQWKSLISMALRLVWHALLSVRHFPQASREKKRPPHLWRGASIRPASPHLSKRMCCGCRFTKPPHTLQVARHLAVGRLEGEVWGCQQNCSILLISMMLCNASFTAGSMWPWTINQVHTHCMRLNIGAWTTWS